MARVLASVCSGPLSALRAISRRNYVGNTSLAASILLRPVECREDSSVEAIKCDMRNSASSGRGSRILNVEFGQLMVIARMNVGALRCHVHLRRGCAGLSTMVG